MAVLDLCSHELHWHGHSRRVSIVWNGHPVKSVYFLGSKLRWPFTLSTSSFTMQLTERRAHKNLWCFVWSLSSYSNFTATTSQIFCLGSECTYHTCIIFKSNVRPKLWEINHCNTSCNLPYFHNIIPLARSILGTNKLYEIWWHKREQTSGPRKRSYPMSIVYGTPVFGLIADQCLMYLSGFLSCFLNSWNCMEMHMNLKSFCLFYIDSCVWPLGGWI